MWMPSAGQKASIDVVDMCEHRLMRVAALLSHSRLPMTAIVEPVWPSGQALAPLPEAEAKAKAARDLPGLARCAGPAKAKAAPEYRRPHASRHESASGAPTGRMMQASDLESLKAVQAASFDIVVGLTTKTLNACEQLTALGMQMLSESLAASQKHVLKAATVRTCQNS